MLDSIAYKIFVLFAVAYGVFGCLNSGIIQVRRRIILPFGGGIKAAVPAEQSPIFWRISTTVLFLVAFLMVGIFIYLILLWFM